MTPFGICMALTAQPLATATGMHRSQHLTKTDIHACAVTGHEDVLMRSHSREHSEMGSTSRVHGQRSSLSSREVELAARPPLSRTSKRSQQPERHASSASVASVGHPLELPSGVGPLLV